MRLATILEGDRAIACAVAGPGLLPLDGLDPAFASVRGIAAGGDRAIERIRAWIDCQPESAYRPLAGAVFGPAVPDPGAIYAIGLNYRAGDEPRGERATEGRGLAGDRVDVAGDRVDLAGGRVDVAAPVADRDAGAGPDRAVPGPRRPLVYAKLPSSVAGHGATLAWDRSLTANVDAEVELAVVIGSEADRVTSEDALGHVLGYTCLNDVSSRDEWLDGDQWLLGKSMAGFCPIGPWIVTRDELDVSALRLTCAIDGVLIQDGTTAQMRSSIPELISYLSRHVALRPGDVVATGTPARLAGPPGPERHLEAGDLVTVWIEGIGELATTIA